MNEKDNFDIDDELARSLERLVEEETNVAKAAYSDEEHVNNENINSESVRKASKSIDLDATQMVDRDMVKSLATGGSGASQNRQVYEKNEMPELSDDDLEDDEADLTEGIKDERSALKKEKEAAPHGLTKRNKLIIAGVSGLVVLVVLIIVIVAVVINSNNKKSYEYNYDKGMEYYNSQDYNQAVDFLSKAFATSDGKKNVEMMCALADAYNRTGQTDKAIEVLKEALAYDKLNEKALTALAQLYQDNKNGAELTELIRDYKGTKSESVLDAYKVSAPTPSETPGNFDDAIELRLMAADGCDIYYTIDGVTYGPDHSPEMSAEEFYAKMRAGSMPKTQQVNPDQAIRRFREYLQQGKDILHIALTSAVSGSCNSARLRITFNYLLVRFPTEAVEYVVAHEFAHLVEANHSPRFYAVLGQLMPDFKARERILKEEY